MDQTSVLQKAGIIAAYYNLLMLTDKIYLEGYALTLQVEGLSGYLTCPIETPGLSI
jgi:hypothetical protein